LSDLLLLGWINEQKRSKFERQGLEQLLAFVRSGDTVTVWKLDRLGRSLKDLIESLNFLDNRGIDFISLTEHIDTTTHGGKLIFHLMGALAEFERDLIREHTNACLNTFENKTRLSSNNRYAIF
jgi:DNA invertase Pin-like site-specific DNA recombinase